MIYESPNNDPKTYGLSNKKFIDLSQTLLEKLEYKGLWDKNTLVVGIDRGVRPLVYTMRKLSKEEGKDTPNMRFLYYSWRTMDGNEEFFSEALKRKIDPKKFEGYKNILLLDEHVYSGETLRNVKSMLTDYLSELKKPPKINMAALGFITRLGGYNKEYSEGNEFIFASGDENNIDFELNVGVNYSPNKKKTKKTKNLSKKYKEAIKIPHAVKGEKRKEFLESRNNLKKDINSYLKEKYPEKEEKRKSLEKKLFFGAFILTILVGSFLYGVSITGYSISTISNSNFYGLILVISGIVGILFTKILSKNKKV